jgi:hypothetical protein
MFFLPSIVFPSPFDHVSSYLRPCFFLPLTLFPTTLDGVFFYLRSFFLLLRPCFLLTSTMILLPSTVLLPTFDHASSPFERVSYNHQQCFSYLRSFFLFPPTMFLQPSMVFPTTLPIDRVSPYLWPCFYLPSIVLPLPFDRVSSEVRHLYR